MTTILSYGLSRVMVAKASRPLGSLMPEDNPLEGEDAEEVALDGPGTAYRTKMVAHTGFEPVIFALRGRCPWPLDECATQREREGCGLGAACYGQ